MSEPHCQQGPKLGSSPGRRLSAPPGLEPLPGRPGGGAAQPAPGAWLPVRPHRCRLGGTAVVVGSLGCALFWGVCRLGEAQERRLLLMIPVVGGGGEDEKQGAEHGSETGKRLARNGGCSPKIGGPDGRSRGLGGKWKPWGEPGSDRRKRVQGSGGQARAGPPSNSPGTRPAHPYLLYPLPGTAASVLPVPSRFLLGPQARRAETISMAPPLAPFLVTSPE